MIFAVSRTTYCNQFLVFTNHRIHVNGIRLVVFEAQIHTHEGDDHYETNGCFANSVLLQFSRLEYRASLVGSKGTIVIFCGLIFEAKSAANRPVAM